MKKGVIIFLFLIVIFSSFVSSQPYLTSNSTWQQNLTSFDVHEAIAFGDIDNDGDMDMIQTGCESGDLLGCDTKGKSRVYINNGTSLVWNIVWGQNLTTTYGGSIALGDIDNDGDLDLILTSTFLKIYTNNGTTFTENSTWQQEVTTQSNSNSVNLGDIDNDGDLDLILVDMGNSPGDSVWLNNGTTFIGDTFFGQETLENIKVSSALVDVDNDGDLDSVSTGHTYFSVYLNNLTTLELSSWWGSGGGLDHASVAIGDVDSDGDMDYFTMGLRGACADAVTFYQNNGSTWLSNSTWEDSIVGLFFGSAAFGDYNNNGYLDLVINGQCGGNPYSFIYDGSNSGFIGSNENIDSSQSGSIAWADLNNDNNLDLVNIKRQKIYINNITTPNQEPTPPTSFSSSYNNREIALGWINGSDNETGSDGLYYNLKLGTIANNHSIISGVYGGQGDVSGGGGVAFGYFGNMMQRKNITLKVDRLSPSTTYYWYVQTIDTGLKAGNWSARQNFTTSADMERPIITLNSPVDNYNSSSYNLVFNVTVSDNMNLSDVSLWGDWGGWHLNETNSSGLNNSNYIFTKNLTSHGDGTYTWKIQVEDNVTNMQNSSVRTFTIDTTPPGVVIVSPSNNANSSDTGLNISYTASDSGLGLESCWYSNDTYASNTSINCGTNITSLNWSEGTHNVTIWANDSAGNENSSSINFTIDTINPTITITTPLNNANSTDTKLNINYTVSDSGTGVDSCWYSNDTYSFNTSINCGTNLTTLNWSEGTHNVTIWANDSAGNEGKNTILFTIDTTPPTVTIVNPINATNSSNTGLHVNYTASDSGVGLESCWYSNDTYAGNTSIACGTNLTTLNWSDMTMHKVTIWANDSAGNEGQDIVFFTINTTDVTAPIVTLISPENNERYTSSSQEITFNYNITEKNEISNCSLIIDGSISLTNSSIIKSITQNFAQTFSPATHTWNVNCTDTNNNVGNSSVRSFRISRPTSPPGNGGSSGGGSTTQIVVLKEFDIDFSTEISGTLEVEQGEIKTFTFNSQISHKITLSEITQTSVKIIIESEPIVLVLVVGETRIIDMNGDGINDLEIKLLSLISSKATLLLNKLEGADILSEEELEKEALFDVKVSISNLFKIIKSGRNVIAEIEVFNVNNIGQVDVTVDYYLTSKEDNQTKLAEGSDTLAVEAVTSFVRSLSIPYDTKAGKYLFNVDVKYQDKIMASSGTEFRVIRNYEIIAIVGVFILIVVAIFVYLWRIKRKEEKIEKEVKKLKKSLQKKKIRRRRKKWQK